MKIKTLQWNIGGGKIRDEDADPTEETSYAKDGLAYIADIIREHAPDIITLQETHRNADGDQVTELAQTLGFAHYVNDPYDYSHIEKGYQLGQAILARFPLRSHSFKFLFNPKLTLVRPNGDIWISHNKGVSTCSVAIEGLSVEVKTVHLMPTKVFGLDPLSDDAKKLHSDILRKVRTSRQDVLLQGDFNIDDASLKGSFAQLFDDGMKEVVLDEPTTPNGRKYDHVLYKGLRHLGSVVVTEALTDHFPVISEFEIV